MSGFFKILALKTLVLFLLISCGPKPTSIHTSASASSDSQWETLFNGTDLSGWTLRIVGYPLGENFGDTFRVEDGILKIRYDGYGDNFNNRFGAIYYDEPFSNYRLRVEYRFVGETAPGAPSWGFRDSGVQFHGQAPGALKADQPFPVSLEYNLHGGNGTDERPLGEICANGIIIDLEDGPNTSYCTPPTTKRTFHGDQWVTLEIDVRDGVITHYANGEQLLQYRNPRYNPEHEIAGALIEGGDAAVKGGYISLQSNSHPIDFRKIEILRY